MVALKTSFRPASPVDFAIYHHYKSDPYGKAYVLDNLGNPKADPSYSEYGNPWTFTGRRLDQESGLLQFRERMYDVDLGRFLGRDPIGYEDGRGLQHYVGGNPATFVDPMGTYKEICYDSPMREEQCPEKEAEGGCDPINVSFHFDNRTQQQLAAEAKMPFGKGHPRIPAMEHDRRFGDAVSGGNALGVSSFAEIGQKGSAKCKGCVCIKKLWVIAHGSGAPDIGKSEFRDPNNPRGGFIINLTAKAKKGEHTWSQLGKMLDPLLCKNPDIFVISCHTGSGGAKAGEELVKETRGVVRTYEDVWRTSPKGSYTPLVNNPNQVGKPGHLEMESRMGKGGKVETRPGVHHRPSAQQW